jgi:hypothetical protein
MYSKGNNMSFSRKEILARLPILSILILAAPLHVKADGGIGGGIGLDPWTTVPHVIAEVTPMAGNGPLWASTGLKTNGGLGGYGVLGYSIENFTGSIAGKVLWRVENKSGQPVSADPTTDIMVKGKGGVVASTNATSSGTISLLSKTASGSGGAYYEQAKTTTFAVVSLPNNGIITKEGSFSISLQ